jgi:predicted PolB exonuclease-like 3'-5' exonuclease
MIIALDIETIGNPDAVAFMPEPEVKTGNIKDPAKIAEKQAEAKREQFERAALDALTARVCCFAAVEDGNQECVETIGSIDNNAEIVLIQSIFRFIGTDGCRLVTWNGNGFDLPMIYKRAMILGVEPANFNAPPLNAWTKRYTMDKHFDLMQIWSNWQSGSYAKLDTVARMLLRDHKTDDIDVTKFTEMLASQQGRDTIAKYCLQDTRLTWRLFEKFSGIMFA